MRTHHYHFASAGPSGTGIPLPNLPDFRALGFMIAIAVNVGLWAGILVTMSALL